ncbi:MAG: alginate export family protein [Bacteroidia bacterium]|nr:alginate export family protein [Bacteroidia bacterium]
MPEFKMLRAEENYEFLKDNPSLPRSWYNWFKFIPLNARQDVYLSLGGELRYQYEYFKNENFVDGLADPNGWWLHRYILHSDWHLGNKLRIFGQSQAAFRAFSVPPPRRIDKDELDLHQGFLEYREQLNDHQSLALRLGRQELWYGNRR